MKIAIGSNHSPPHTGGSELIVKQIAESMANEFGHEVAVFSKSLAQHTHNNGVRYVRCPRDFQVFKEQVNHFDMLFIYSDYFFHWDNILRNSEQFKCRIGIALVGMNAMIDNAGLLRLFKGKSHQIKVVTHSDDYQDYRKCKNLAIPVTVIHNGISFNDFQQPKTNFRSKYGIGKKMILCVSNFFPGKGQEHMPRVLKELRHKRDDFVMIFICSTTNFMPAKMVQQAVYQGMQGVEVPFKFFQDLSREDTIAAFFAADAFAFPTQKEVAPVVVLECMAAKLPWVAMPVGNIPSLKGGLMFPYVHKNSEKFAAYGDQSYDMFADNLDKILTNEDGLVEKLTDEGFAQVSIDYNWSQIAKQYNELFTS